MLEFERGGARQQRDAASLAGLDSPAPAPVPEVRASVEEVPAPVQGALLEEQGPRLEIAASKTTAQRLPAAHVGNEGRGTHLAVRVHVAASTARVKDPRADASIARITDAVIQHLRAREQRDRRDGVWKSGASLGHTLIETAATEGEERIRDGAFVAEIRTRVMETLRKTDPELAVDAGLAFDEAVVAMAGGTLRAGRLNVLDYVPYEYSPEIIDGLGLSPDEAHDERAASLPRLTAAIWEAIGTPKGYSGIDPERGINPLHSVAVRIYGEPFAAQLTGVDYLALEARALMFIVGWPAIVDTFRRCPSVPKDVEFAEDERVYVSDALHFSDRRSRPPIALIDGTPLPPGYKRVEWAINKYERIQLYLVTQFWTCLTRLASEARSETGPDRAYNQAVKLLDRNLVHAKRARMREVAASSEQGFRSLEYRIMNGFVGGFLSRAISAAKEAETHGPENAFPRFMEYYALGRAVSQLSDAGLQAMQTHLRQQVGGELGLLAPLLGSSPDQEAGQHSGRSRTRRKDGDPLKPFRETPSGELPHTGCPFKNGLSLLVGGSVDPPRPDITRDGIESHHGTLLLQAYASIGKLFARELGWQT